MKSKGVVQVKGNVIVALIVGAALGFVVGRATVKAPEPAKPTVAAAPAQPTPAAKPTPPTPSQVEDPNAVYRMPVGDSPSWGSSSPKVTIVEGTDFQCPFCSRADATLKQIKETYGPKDIRVSVKQNPLPFHNNAHMAAEAALAAGEQGKYWEMHHKMFDNQKQLERASLEKYAQELQLDMVKFKSALDQQKFKDKIDAEQKLLQSVGAGGTPSFFINGRKVVGAQPFETFKKVIDEEIKKADDLIAKGTSASSVYDELQKGAATSPKMIAAPNQPAAQPERPQQPPAPEFAKVEVASYNPFKGPKAAKVTIVEWSDFQCPFCSRGANVAHEIMKAYPNDVKFVFRHQPLSFHPNAMPAAKAAMAAHKQGKFFEMHDKLFEGQKDLSPAKYEQFAQELQLNMAKFKADMESAEIADQIKKDSDYGNSVGANGTPTFFVNGRKIEGAQPFDEFKRTIDQEIKRADELLKSGTKMENLYEKITSMAPPPPPEPPRVKLEAGNAPAKGPKNAPIQIYEFSDFQCPFCTRVLPTVKQIEETYGNKVVVFWKNYPLPFHDKAPLAAEASLAAHEQGKFWQMHDKLFANQSALDRASLEKYAQELQLDMTKFKAALDSGKFKDQVKKDMDQGSTAGVSGTPSFVVNGKLVVGAQPFEEFKKVIDAELAAKK
ncbi:MAG: thioredoxin domain-containing protein [Myxococcales bacterium]